MTEEKICSDCNAPMKYSGRRPDDGAKKYICTNDPIQHILYDYTELV